MRDDPDQYFDKVKVVNFDITHDVNKLIGNYKDCKTIKNEHLTRYPKGETEVVLSVAFRNKRDDLWVKGDIMIKHLWENLK